MLQTQRCVKAWVGLFHCHSATHQPSLRGFCFCKMECQTTCPTSRLQALIPSPMRCPRIAASDSASAPCPLDSMLLGVTCPAPSSGCASSMSSNAPSSDGTLMRTPRQACHGMRRKQNPKRSRVCRNCMVLSLPMPYSRRFTGPNNNKNY